MPRSPHNPTELDDAALVDRLVATHPLHAPTREQWEELLGGPDGELLVVYLVAFRDQAAYPPGSGEPERSGRDAFFLAGQTLAAVIADVGGRPALGGFVQQILAADDGSRWDYVGAARYPSRSAFVRLWLDERSVTADLHRCAGTSRHRLHLAAPLF